VRHTRAAARDAIEREADRRLDVVRFDDRADDALHRPGSPDAMSTEAVRRRLLDRAGPRPGSPSAVAAFSASFGPVISTKRGARAELTLPVSSTARLGARAAVSTSTTLAEAARALVISGPDSLSLTADPSRPVAIGTGSHRWNTDGAVAAFDREDERTFVLVDSGRVELLPRSEETRLEAGRAVAIDAAGNVTPLDAASRDAVFGWRTGRLRLQGVSALALRDQLLKWFDSGGGGAGGRVAGGVRGVTAKGVEVGVGNGSA